MKEFLKKIDIRNLIRYVVILIALIVFGYSAYQLVLTHLQDAEGEAVISGVSDLFTKEYETDESGERVTDEAGEPVVIEGTGDGASFHWDYDLLLTYNSSALGYIRQENGEYIDYPILQHTDNQYYLNHLPDHTYNRIGSIYVDYRIGEGLNAKNPIVYGHRMGAPTGNNMFGSLVWYINKTGYEQQHPDMDVYIGYKHYKYYVFACYETPAVGSDTYRYSFSSDEEFLKYVEECKAKSIKEFPLAGEITADDYILTLSTCTVDDKSERTIIQLVRREEIED